MRSSALVPEYGYSRDVGHLPLNLTPRFALLIEIDAAFV